MADLKPGFRQAEMRGNRMSKSKWAHPNILPIAGKWTNKLHSIRLYPWRQRQCHILVFSVIFVLETFNNYLVMEKGQEKG